MLKNRARGELGMHGLQSVNQEHPPSPPLLPRQGGEMNGKEYISPSFILVAILVFSIRRFSRCILASL